MYKSDKELLDWLRDSDEHTYLERLVRLKFVRSQYASEEFNVLFYGGHISARAFGEMQLSFIQGAFISCLLTAQIVLEHSLDALLTNAGRTDLNGYGFAKLCAAALEEKLISQDEHDNFSRLRNLRNPYTHSTPFMKKHCVIKRSVESKNTLEQQFETDAEFALSTVIQLIMRYPFTLSAEDY